MALTKADKQLEAVAGNIIENLLPDPDTRLHCLRILAHSINYAHRKNSRKWSVTLYPGGEKVVRLTVGMIYVVNISHDQISITVDGRLQDYKVLQNYAQAIDIEALKSVQSKRPYFTGNSPLFNSAPEAVWCWFAVSEIEKAWPLVQQSHERLLTYLAHDTNLNPATRRGYAAGVLKYVRNSLGTGIPNPDF
jgi:hypothetical protein